jgi:hypothetical protein
MGRWAFAEFIQQSAHCGCSIGFYRQGKHVANVARGSDRASRSRAALQCAVARDLDVNASVKDCPRGLALPEADARAPIAGHIHPCSARPSVFPSSATAFVLPANEFVSTSFRIAGFCGAAHFLLPQDRPARASSSLRPKGLMMKSFAPIFKADDAIALFAAMTGHDDDRARFQANVQPAGRSINVTSNFCESSQRRYLRRLSIIQPPKLADSQAAEWRSGRCCRDRNAAWLR